MKARLFLCGAGNPEGVRLALNVAGRSGRWDDVVLLDDDPALHGTQVLGIPVEGGFEVLGGADAGRDRVVNLVARTASGRRGARERILGFGIPFAPLIAPGVNIFGVDLPRDIIVYPGGHLGADSTVAEGTVVFMGAMIGHGARVGACCVLAPGAVLNARVRLGDEVYVGTNASVLPEVELGDGVKVGAGSVVLTDLDPGASVLGVPAETLYVGPRVGAGSGTDPSSGFGTRRERVSADNPGRSGSTGLTAFEQVVEEVWCEVLGLDEVALDKNFFEMGARSVDAAEACKLLCEQLDAEVALTDLFRYTTVRGLGRHLSESLDDHPAETRTEPMDSPAERGASRAERRKRSSRSRREGYVRGG